MRKALFLIILSALIFCLTSFAVTTVPELPKKYLHVPHIAQATEYSCGAAALLSTLLYWDVYDDNESSLYTQLGTTAEQGTHPTRMEAFAKSLGLNAQWKEALSLHSLDAALADCTTVIAAFQAWHPDGQNSGFDWSNEWESGHYAVLIGSDQEFLYFMDPSSYRGYAYLNRQDFLLRWHDYENEKTGPRRYIHAALFIKGTKSVTGPHDSLGQIF